MLDQKKLDCFKKHGGSAALELRGEMVSALKDRISETVQAVNAYFDDRKKKELAIAGRIEELQDQKAELTAEVSAFGPKLASATISGDSDTLEEIQAQLTDLEARKAATTAQIELLSTVAVSGDEELFSKADERAKNLAAFWTETQNDLTALSAFSDEQVTLWSQVGRMATLGGDILPRNSVFSRVDEMRRDFHEKEGANNE